jgi:hypothetical protein
MSKTKMMDYSRFSCHTSRTRDIIEDTYELKTKNNIVKRTHSISEGINDKYINKIILRVLVSAVSAYTSKLINTAISGI